MPSLDHLFRLYVEMAPPRDHTIVSSPHGTPSTRVIMPIAGGTVAGPNISGIIVPNSGADWATNLSGTDVSHSMVSAPNHSSFEMPQYWTLATHAPQNHSSYSANHMPKFTKLDAKYTLKTSDNHSILVHSFGIYSRGPTKPASSPSTPPPETVTQNQVEWFTHIELEAPGDSPYNDLNSVLAVGILSQSGGKIYIDVYRLTNFPGVGGRSFDAGAPSAKL